MPHGGTRLSIDLSSTALAATVQHRDARIPVTPHPAMATYAGLTGGPATPAGGHPMAPGPSDPYAAGPQEDAVAVLAQRLRDLADQASGQVGQPVTALVVVIPPGWGPRRRGHLTDAAARAGLPAPVMVTAPAVLASYTAGAHRPPDGACLLIYDGEQQPATLTVLQVSEGGYRELATTPLNIDHDIDRALAEHVVATLPAPGTDVAAQPIPADDQMLLHTVRQARLQLSTQDRAAVLLPDPYPPAVITRDDLTAAEKPFHDTATHTVTGLIDTADITPGHLAAVIYRDTTTNPAVAHLLTTVTARPPITLAGHTHALTDGALTLTTTHHQASAADSHLPRARLRIRDLTTTVLLAACSMTLLIQTVTTADTTTIETRVTEVRVDLPQLGIAAALVMLSALAVAHLTPTTWLSTTPTTGQPEPTTGTLIRGGYLTTTVAGIIAATLYGLAAASTLNTATNPHLTWTLGCALPLAAAGAIVAVTAPRIPAIDLPAWLTRTRPALLPAAMATTGIYLMQAALTLTPPVNLTGLPGLIGSTAAALLGAATVFTATTSRLIRTITAPGLAIGYAIVFSYNTHNALLDDYLIALTWWALRLAAHTTRLAYPTVGQTLRRLLDDLFQGIRGSE